jgi:alanine racemase
VSLAPSREEPAIRTGASWGRPAWAEIDLDAIAHNARAIKGLVGPAVELIAVVKANAYGHGAMQVAAAAHAAGAERIAVSCVDEAVELRNAGLNAPILILGYTPVWEAQRVVVNALTPTLMSRPLAEALNEVAGDLGETQPIQLKVDTGMGRFGLLPDECLAFAEWVGSQRALWLEGIYTHFARADEPEAPTTATQLLAFNQVLERLAERGIAPPLVHAANSAGTIEFPEARFGAVRCGIALTGLYPSGTRDTLDLRPAMALKARIARLRKLPRGSSVGYGGTYTLASDADVALVPMGYADGLPISLSNRGIALVRGQRVPMIGRISMDATTLLLQDVAADEDDEVVVVGRQGSAAIGAEEQAALADTLHYELVTRIPPRLPRVYLRGGQPVQVQTLLGSYK